MELWNFVCTEIIGKLLLDKFWGTIGHSRKEKSKI